MKAIHLKINLLSLSILLGLVSCNALKTNKSTKPIAMDTLYFSTNFIQIDSNNIANYACETFVENALTNYSIASIKQDYKFLKCTQEPTTNIHNPTTIDTVYIFSNNKNKLQVYRARNKDFIFMLDVTNPKFILAENIKPGMSKVVFSRKFQITESIDDKIQLTNPKSNTSYMFYFRRNTLKRITANIYLD